MAIASSLYTSCACLVVMYPDPCVLLPRGMLLHAETHNCI
jgi:hypothetical protein